jgi:hypothetical protein
MTVKMNVVLSVPEICCPARQEDALLCPSLGEFYSCQSGRGTVLSVREVGCSVSQLEVMSCQSVRYVVLSLRER